MTNNKFLKAIIFCRQGACCSFLALFALTTLLTSAFAETYSKELKTKETYLTISDSDGTSVLELPLNEIPTWIFRWNHSVTGVTVSDYYFWDGSNIILTDSHTPAFDAGLGHIPGRGKLKSDGLNGYFIIGIDEAVPNNRYALRVGSLRVNHRIEHAGEIYSLSEQVANKRVTVQVISNQDNSDTESLTQHLEVQNTEVQDAIDMINLGEKTSE